MKSLKGILFIIASFVLTLLTWMNTSPQFMIPGLALTSLSLTFILATRLPLLESWFHGLEKVYTVHKFTAFLSIILLIFHNFSMGGLWGTRLAAQFGNLAIYIFISIILVAYLGKYIQYEAWRWIHRLVYLAYIFGLFHVYMMMGNRLLTFNLLSFLVGSYALLGLLAGFYIIFLYQKISFPYLGKITNLKRLNHDTREIQIHLSKSFNYQAGQFAFLKIFQESFESAPHPFSISGGHGRTLYFTIKNSGDHTKNIYDNLQVGSKVSVDRAYGHMIIEEGQETQVWIAGGIGITPFISYIREHPILDKQVHFYYSFRGEENAVYLDLLRDYAQKNPNFELYLVDSRKDGYLHFEQKEMPEQATIYMCGPLSMMKSFAKQIRKQSLFTKDSTLNNQSHSLGISQEFFLLNRKKHCQISSSVLSFIYLSRLFFQFLHRRSVLCSSQIQVQLLHLFASSHERQLWQQIRLYQLGSKGEILNQAILIQR